MVETAIEGEGEGEEEEVVQDRVLARRSFGVLLASWEGVSGCADRSLVHAWDDLEVSR